MHRLSQQPRPPLSLANLIEDLVLGWGATWGERMTLLGDLKDCVCGHCFDLSALGFKRTSKKKWWEDASLKGKRQLCRCHLWADALSVHVGNSGSKWTIWPENRFPPTKRWPCGASVISEAETATLRMIVRPEDKSLRRAGTVAFSSSLCQVWISLLCSAYTMWLTTGLSTNTNQICQLLCNPFATFVCLQYAPITTVV